MKHCPTSTTCTHPASIQNYLLTLLSCESDLIRSSIVAIEFDDVKGFHCAKELLP